MLNCFARLVDMPATRDYVDAHCSLARSLEIVGERWTLLILRDAFYGVRRFGDFVSHLKIPRAVLTERLSLLVDAGVLDKVGGAGRREHYELTDKGERLWPVVLNLMSWGDDFYAPSGPRRLFLHADDDAPVASNGICTGCGRSVDARDFVVAPRPGTSAARAGDEPVHAALARPHRLLEPLL